MKQTPSGTVRILCLGGTVGGTGPQRRARHRPRVCKRSIFASSLCLCRPRARKRNNEFGKYAWLGIDVDLAAMLFHHDVVAPDFDLVAKAFRGRAQRRLKTVFTCFLALGGGVKTI